MAPLILNRGENSRIDVQRDLDGGALIAMQTAAAVTHFRVSRENAIGMAMALLEAAGVPPYETFTRRLAMQKEPRR